MRSALVVIVAFGFLLLLIVSCELGSMDSVSPSAGTTNTAAIASNSVLVCDHRDLTGCCSDHGGINSNSAGCVNVDVETGRILCNDGTVSPSCSP
jgi:hypothetical protein